MIPHSRPTLGEEEKKACLDVLDSLQIAQGEKAAEFEKKFAESVKRRYAVAVSSGTSALVLSLLALEISEGDEVIIPSYTCAALLHALDGVGAKPVLADIDAEDFNISVADVKKKITSKTKAVIVPHLFGRPARIHELANLSLPVIEDGTQALGACAGNKPIGSFGILSVFSFYATKMITTGEGGMIVTDSRRLAEKILDSRDYDKKKNFRFRTNSKMTDLEAAIGLEQLKKLPEFIQKRREIASEMNEAFHGAKVILPQAEGSRTHVYFRYVVRMPNKPLEWIKRFVQEGLDVKKPIFKPLHRYLGKPDTLFPVTVQAMRQACSIPIYPSLSSEERSMIIQGIRNAADYCSHPSEKILMPAS